MSGEDDRMFGRCPFDVDGASTPSRRNLLLGAGLAGGATLLGGASAHSKPDQDRAIATESERANHAHDDTPHDFESDGTRDRQPFYGLHQSGVVNPQPAAAILVAFNVIATSRDDIKRLLVTLTRRIAFLTEGGENIGTNPQMPPPDNGILGPEIYPDSLTITVGVGASLFDDRFGLASLKPKHLTAMDQFPNDALDSKMCHGDLFIQFCANTNETNIHALRDIVRATPDLLDVRWQMSGFLPPHTLKKLGKDTVRNLLGFKDGTANINAQDSGLMDELVWLKPDHGEPQWAHEGTYQVVRLIHMTVERWDRTPLGEQETIMGRLKMSGAPLGMTHERDVPDYAGPEGRTIAKDAHIRLANPRTAETRSSRILRRPYNYSRDAISKSGQLDMGLAFICFQSDLDKGFRTVQARLDGEPLEEYIKPFGGGYFFVLPGVKDKNEYLAKGLIDASPQNERGPV